MFFGSQPDWSKWQKVTNPEELEFDPKAMEIDGVTGWRFGYLCAAGFDPQTALQLAESKDVDLRKVDHLLEKGCTHEVAVEILL